MWPKGAHLGCNLRGPHRFGSAVNCPDKIAHYAVAPAALVLSACNLLGPRYTRPDIPVPPGRVVDTTQTSGEAQATAVANEAIAIGRTGAPAKPASALAAGPVVAQPKI